MALASVFPAGFLPLNSTDDSIVLECDMTSSANIIAAGGTLQTGATVDASGVLSGSAGGVKFDLSALNYASLDNAGHMYIEVETYGIGELHTAVGSNGYDHTGNDYLAHWNDADGVTPPYGRILVNVNEQIQMELNTDDANDVIAGPHTLGIGQYSDLHISWQGNEYKYYVNGVLAQTKTRVGYDANKFRYIMLGALMNGTSPFAAPAKIRQFLIANRPLMFSTHPQMMRVLYWGDSFVTNADPDVSTTYYLCAAQQTFKRYFAKRGIETDLIIDGHSGYEIWDGATNDLQSTRAAMLANDPQVVIIQALTNDALRNPLEANIETDYKDHITTIMAHPSVERIIISTAPTTQANSTYNSATYVSNIETLRQMVYALPNWWDTNNPSNTGVVSVSDTFEIFGKESPEDNTFVGQVNGLFNDLHPGAKGAAMMGEGIASTLYNQLM